jgi:hypothetical protein
LVFFFEADLKVCWDVAAELMVREAGGFVTDYTGGMKPIGHMRAANGLHSKLHKILANHLTVLPMYSSDRKRPENAPFALCGLLVPKAGHISSYESIVVDLSGICADTAFLAVAPGLSRPFVFY